MRFIAVAALLFLAQVNVGGPTEVQDPNYPLRVKILQRNTTRGSYGMREWGRANLEGTPEQGFDYQSDCGTLFMVSRGAELYSAKWKKQDKEMEMLVSKMGTGKSDKCTVKTDLKSYVYAWENGEIVTKPMAGASN